MAFESSARDVRITAQLVDAQVDAQLWADKFTGTFSDMLEMQERLSRQIVDALRLRLTPADERRMAHRSIADARAYDLYLRARQQIWSFSGPALDRALQLIRQAEEIVGESELLIAAEGMIYWQYVNVGLRPATHVRRVPPQSRSLRREDLRAQSRIIERFRAARVDSEQPRRSGWLDARLQASFGAGP